MLVHGFSWVQEIRLILGTSFQSLWATLRNTLLGLLSQIREAKIRR
jgi:hypothetical protein